MTVYMIVTRDKYRLPRWWGTTTAGLAQLSGRKYQNVRVGICKAFRHGGRLNLRRYYEGLCGKALFLAI